MARELISLALEPPAGDLFRLTEEHFRTGFAASHASPRKRIVFPIQRSQDAPVQRMINFLQPGTYIRPHVHSGEGATETIHVLRGKILFVHFSKSGEILDKMILCAEDPAPLIDIQPGLWHSFLPLTDNTAVLEIKKGPYSPTHDKDFAPWAPVESHPDASGYMQRLIQS